MDKKTLEVYDRDAARYAKDWMSQPDPEEIHGLVKKFFIPQGNTADIGAGSGRDCAWLNSQGFPCDGFDASDGLIAEARKNFPELRFEKSLLPELSNIPDDAYTNVLCETVLQHLPRETHLDCLLNLLRITKPGGVLSLSFRHPHQKEGDREKDERLYVLVDSELFIAEAQKSGTALLHRDQIVSVSSGKVISQLIFKKA